MTRAQQTISLALLVTSVPVPLPQTLASPCRCLKPVFGTNLAQVYLAFAFQLIPLNTKVQDDIIPVVSIPRFTLPSSNQ